MEWSAAFLEAASCDRKIAPASSASSASGRWSKSAAALALLSIIWTGAATAEDGLRGLVAPKSPSEKAAPGPALDFGPSEGLPALAPGEADTVILTQVRIEDGTAFTGGEFDAIAQPFLGRRLTVQDLVLLRDAVTRLYVDRGYLNSGAILPDQDLKDGVLRLKIVEGWLSVVQVSGVEHVSADYIAGQLTDDERPLDIHRVEDRLQLLRQSPSLQTVQATMRPGVTPGTALLDVAVEETPPLSAGLSFHNQSPPAVGAEKAVVFASYRNLLGRDDVLTAQFGHLIDHGGIEDYSFGYDLPVSARGTVLSLTVDRSESVITSPPFDQLDIQSRTTTFAVGIRQPLYRTAAEQFAVSLRGQRRESDTSLLGEPFSFSEGVQNGHTVVNAISFGQDWVRREANQVFAATSVFTQGLGVWRATRNATGADGRFTAWLGQGQWARHLDLLDSQAILRTSLRLSSSQLLPSEKFSIGGLDSVRGYREALLSRDQGWVSSAEWRVPTGLRLPVPYLSAQPDDGGIAVAAFFDHGLSWNAHASTDSPHALYAAGLGMLWQIGPQSKIEFYYGKALRTVPLPQDRDLQDDGIHFRITLVPLS